MATAISIHVQRGFEAFEATPRGRRSRSDQASETHEPRAKLLLGHVPSGTADATLEALVRHEPTSAVFGAMLSDIGPTPITLDHVLHKLGERSFGMMLLLLSILGLLPGISALAGLLGLVVAWQMLLGRPRPVFPRSLAQRRFEPRRLRAIVTRVVPVLRWLERIVRPRWTTPFQTTKRVVGAAVALLALALLVPVPLSNLAPALAMGLVAIAYVEEDGLLLSVALMIVAVLLATGGLLLWEAASTTGWIESAF
ncbi:exopolysaccharide biosynthesis protein [Plastoroseomonas hellenica]|uniref:exopolysaccharide biosynthesis protein n=1 Tax=Plastoroseomonas hellenica TaxID=2687306 RepID=UPI001BAB0B12|nr:exopolysaccharide biosynthesis protein [Plastoroseomonas hellenica]MBR0645983.1 exopolysaccharide biosynthesis protein [Plastoroseomonas hellenica]